MGQRSMAGLLYHVFLHLPNNFSVDNKPFRDLVKKKKDSTLYGIRKI